MDQFIIQKVKKLFSKDTQLIKIIDLYKNLINILHMVDKVIIFESLVMLNDISNYFQISLFTNSVEENSIVQIRLDLKYKVQAPMYILQNILYSDCEKDFWYKVKNTNAVKYIINNELIPYDISLLELEV